MWTWLLENLATILISAVLLAVIAAIIVHLARNRRAGKNLLRLRLLLLPDGGEVPSKIPLTGGAPRRNG